VDPTQTETGARYVFHDVAFALAVPVSANSKSAIARKTATQKRTGAAAVTRSTLKTDLSTL